LIIEFYALIALMCISALMYLKTRRKAWLLLALGSFFLTGNAFSGLIYGLVGLFVSPSHEFSDLLFNLEIIISVSMIAIGFGLILRETWNKYYPSRQPKSLK